LGKRHLALVKARALERGDVDVEVVASDGVVVDLVCPKSVDEILFTEKGLYCAMDEVFLFCPLDFILGVDDENPFDCDLDSVICSACRSGFCSDNYEELECPLFLRSCYYVGFCKFLVGFPMDYIKDVCHLDFI
jgi:hypothetical protein